MNPRARSAAAALAFTCLVACGAPPPHVEDKQAAKADAEAHGRSTDATVFDDTIHTEDRARAVEGVTMGAKANLDTAIENSEGDGKPKDDGSGGQ